MFLKIRPQCKLTTHCINTKTWGFKFYNVYFQHNTFLLLILDWWSLCTCCKLITFLIMEYSHQLCHHVMMHTQLFLAAEHSINNSLYCLACMTQYSFHRSQLMSSLIQCLPSSLSLISCRRHLKLKVSRKFSKMFTGTKYLNRNSCFKPD